MANIVDRRGKAKSKLSGSRSKFINRYKNSIKKKVLDHVRHKKLKDINSDVEIDLTGTDEIYPSYSGSKGKIKGIHPGNKQYDKGNRIRMNESGGGSGSGGGDSDEITYDDFKFMLTKKELMDILFEDMELPNFLKKNSQQMEQVAMVSGGYVKEGIPARLAVKKTLQNAIARRIASAKPKDQTRFLDDIDLRYRNLIPNPKPISTAVVFFVMDVSGSMWESRKMLAKKFYLLFYLFLEKHYNKVEVRFISHTTEAYEVTEEEFFYSTLSGGTIASTAIEKVNSIIDSEYDHSQVNIYVAQASDGDNWSGDYEDLLNEMAILLPKVQYFAYIEVDSKYSNEGICHFYDMNIQDDVLNTALIKEDKDVLPVLHKLFRRE